MPNLSSKTLFVIFDKIPSYPGLLVLFSEANAFLVLNRKVLFFRDLDLHT